jgi:eukaryotic-like serine/threonine-protein kinase
MAVREQPTAFGPYRVVRALGQGSGGTVHLALHEHTGAAVALKLVALETDHDEPPDGPRRRFVAEAQTLRRLVHPHIAAVLAVGEAAGVGWLAIEWVPGSDLSRYTRAPRLLPEPLVRHIGAALCEALAFAHGQGIVHRDVKPSNVLIDLPQQLVKLSDFGIARDPDAEATRTGVVLGSPAFLAPEQLAGALPTASSDLYALGVMLFELLAGRLPFDAPSMGELLRQVAQQEAPDLRALCPQVSAELASVVASLLRKNSAERPHDAAALAQRLRAGAGAWGQASSGAA